MPNKLEPSLSRCSVDMVRKSIRSLIASGLTIDEVDEILDELEGWLAWKDHPSPDIWEGPNGWYRMFSTFVIEGDAEKTCPSRILRRQGFRSKPGAVDLDRPDTWKKRPPPKKS